MIELIPLELQYCEEVADIAKENLPEAWSLSGIQDVLRYSDNIYYVARQTDNREIVGFAGIMLIADEAELLNIAVRKDFQGQGVGQLLLEKVMEKGCAGGAGRMLLEVRKSNIPAIKLYHKNLFSVLGERKNYYSNPTEDAIIMVKNLCNANDYL